MLSTAIWMQISANVWQQSLYPRHHFIDATSIDTRIDQRRRNRR